MTTPFPLKTELVHPSDPLKPTVAEYKVGIGKLWDALTGLFGIDGEKQTALTTLGAAGTGANTFSGDQTLGAGKVLVFEGATDDGFETKLTVVDPTADRTITLPDEDIELGFRNIPQKINSASYTCVLADSGKHILHPSSDTIARTFTIPANASVAYPIGTAITFVNQAAAGVLTIAITTDTMRLAGAGTTGSRTLAANGIATALKLTATEWIISGTGLS